MTSSVVKGKQTNWTNKQICYWKEKENSDEDIWQTECGKTWLASERNREDTSFFYCPYCGGEISGALGLYMKRFYHMNFWNRKDRFNRVPPELIK